MHHKYVIGLERADITKMLSRPREDAPFKPFRSGSNPEPESDVSMTLYTMVWTWPIGIVHSG
jgi:hypothetical protein